MVKWVLQEDRLKMTFPGFAQKYARKRLGRAG